MSDRRPLAVWAITRHGIGHAERLCNALPQADLFVSEKLASLAPERASLVSLPLGPILNDRFQAYDGHVFVVSIGAVVRMVAPLLRNKKVDPAVVCVDDAARFSICVLSGHVGRGNELAERVASVLGAEPVVTTASDAIGTLTVDILGRELGWELDDPDRNVTRGCAAVVNEAKVLFVHEAGEPDFWPTDRPLPKNVQYTRSLDGVDPRSFEILLVATDRDVARSHPSHFANAVVYRPKSLALGIGCDRGTPVELVERGVVSLLEEAGLSLRAVRCLATIDVKADEEALLALSAKYGWPLRTYPAATLDEVPGIENPSEVVKKHVGTRAVAEPAALLAAGADRLLLPKRAYTEPGANRSMTLAVARVPSPARTNEVLS